MIERTACLVWLNSGGQGVTGKQKYRLTQKGRDLIAKGAKEAGGDEK
jgi:hypothetical protein